MQEAAAFGLICHMSDDWPVKMVLLSSVDGVRQRGRPPKRRTDNITEWTELTLCEAVRLSQDHDAPWNRIVFGSQRDHVRPALKELHWLPVVFRIKFKVALMMFTVHTRRCPDYLIDSVQACNSDPGRTRLRSASSTNYSVPRTRTKFGDRAISVAGPVVWNSLPASVREADSLYSFKRKLKTHLFTMCFTD